MMFAGNLRGITQTLPLAVLEAMESDTQLAVVISVVSLALAFGALIGGRAVARQWRV
jgi:molybdate transport system permease protein